MKIIFFLPSLEGGGAEKTMLRIANYISEDKGNKVTLMLLNRSSYKDHRNAYDGLISPNMKVIDLCCLIGTTSKIAMMRRIRTTICKQNPDAIISTMLKANILISVALVGTCYTNKLILRESCKRSTFMYSFFEKCIIEISYNYLCKKIIALSNGVADDISHTFRVKKEKIIVIYNPVDIKLVNQKAAHSECIEKKHEVQFVSIGRLHEIKDYHTIIEALKLIKKDYCVDLGEWILGEGPEQENIESHINKSGLQKEINLLGFEDNPYKYLCKADALILSSKNEGFANVIIEAMALGVPVISSNCDYGPKEIIVNKKNGLLFEIGNEKSLAKCIIEFINDKELQKKLHYEGKKRAEDFDISIIGLEYRKLLYSIENTHID